MCSRTVHTGWTVFLQAWAKCPRAGRVRAGRCTYECLSGEYLAVCHPQEGRRELVGLSDDPTL